VDVNAIVYILHIGMYPYLYIYLWRLYVTPLLLKLKKNSPCDKLLI